MWQRLFEEHGNSNFTVVGLALDAEGTAPAELYYKKHGVTFPALVDPNYATGFGAVPKTFFVDEHGVVQDLRKWKEMLPTADDVLAVSEKTRSQWSNPSSRFEPGSLARLVEANRQSPRDMAIAAQLGSRYLALGLPNEAASILQRAVAGLNPKQIARQGGTQSQRLGQAYFQLMRCFENDREKMIEYATLSYRVNPSIGFGKQITRLIDPAKFDETESGRLDNRFREATYRRLQRERAEWLEADSR